MTSEILAVPLAAAASKPEQNPKLNFDILVLLFQFFPYPCRNTIMSLMKTCHFLRSAGIPHLLSHPIKFTCSRGLKHRKSSRKLERTLSSLSGFILADPHRATYLRHIEIHAGDLPDNTVAQVSAILHMAVSLRILLVEDCCPIVGLAVLEALVDNTSIKTLSSPLLNGDMVHTLQRWQAPLESVQVTVPKQFCFRDSHTPNLFRTLQSFSATMKEITARFVAPSPSFGPVLHLRSYSELVFSHVKKLQFDIRLLSGLDLLESLPEIVHAYPNLTHLQLQSKSVSRVPATSLERLDGIRRANLVANSAHCWGHLDTVCGRIEVIYALGLLCTIRDLTLSIPDVSEDIPAMLDTLLSATRPSQLTLYLSNKKNGGNVVEATLQTVYLKPCLVSLSICLNLRGSNTNIAQIVDTFVNLLSTFSALQDLQLEIRHDDDRSSHATQDTQTITTDEPADPMKAFLEICDLPSLGVRLAQRINTLNKLSLQFSGSGIPDWYSLRWRISVDPDAQGEKTRKRLVLRHCDLPDNRNCPRELLVS